MLNGRYEFPLVVISVLVAIFASYTALSLAERVGKSHGVAARWWIAGGAVAMGTGIWSMHFIGMLAFRLPIALGYDLGITLLSLLLPILVSGMALWQLNQPQLPLKRLFSGALLMGLGINSMHYTGMAAMRMDPGILYDPWLFAASVVIAVGASAAALWVAFRLRENLPHALALRAAAAVIMGFAIVGMHYTGMAAANFPLDSICLAASHGFSQNGLAIMVIIGTLAVLTVALLTSVFDARLESRSQVLALSEATARERQALLLRERTAREQAERMSEMKDEFLATLSHELRTPLNAILGWANILHQGVSSPEALKRGLDTIERNARAQARLIDDMLDMSRIISGKVRLEIHDLNPAAVIDAALDTVRPAAIAKNIELVRAVDPHRVTLLGDASRLQQVLWNLLSNAVKFTPDGGQVRISMVKTARHVQIRVSDSGIGIEPAFLPYVFDRFRQADASTTRRYGGLGLGLAIVKSLVELHGGTVSVTSEGKGQGAMFTLRLPLGARKAEPFRQAEEAAKGPSDAPPFIRADLGNLTVLAVDDDADALDLIERILEDCGAKVLRAANAAEALACIRQEHPDAMVSDIGMPDVDGFQLIRQVRALERGQSSQIQAIALTAFTRARDQELALQAGFNCFLSKPVEPSQLVATLATMAGHRAGL